MNLGFDIGAGLGGVLNAGASIFNTISANNWAKKNYGLQKQSQDEAMFMNRNQFQVQSADAQKAGINPLAMQGGSVGSASAQNVDAPQIDMSGINSILGTVLQAKSQKNLQKDFQEWKSEEDAKQRKHEEVLASLKIDAENKRHSEQLAQSQKQFDANLDELKSYHSEMISVQNRNVSAKEKANLLQELRDKVAETSADVLNDLRKQQGWLNEVDLQTRARELANLIRTGTKQHNDNSMVSMFRNLGIAISGANADVNEIQKAIVDYVKNGRK